MHAPFAIESFKVTNKERFSLSLSGRIRTGVKEQYKLSEDEKRNDVQKISFYRRYVRV